MSQVVADGPNFMFNHAEVPDSAPEIASHRILAESSVGAVREHDTALLRPLAERFNLTYAAFGVALSEPGASSSRTLTLADTYALEPAPVLAGSIMAAYSTRRAANGDSDNNPIAVVPLTMSGNTDTRYYWQLSRHIFRYGHGNSGGCGPEDALGNMHTVNESIDADDFVEIIRLGRSF
ncbi:hypothetical protein B0H17DRAFT_1210748 [Mycena rosella]|uniref:Uncharacterized protein n=1 Tax=Mycena rosella TaxID=1033263 RepID=A0AAD7CW92_MYCRO|nr:hypothetical protein B0H17DRAFT_1210748 [Mycena rosella]